MNKIVLAVVTFLAVGAPLTRTVEPTPGGEVPMVVNVYVRDEAGVAYRADGTISELSLAGRGFVYIDFVKPTNGASGVLIPVDEVGLLVVKEPKP